MNSQPVCARNQQQEELCIFSSPIQGIQLSSSRPHHGSPGDSSMEFCQSGSFRKIVEKENEDEEDNEAQQTIKISDMEGNTICEFKTYEEAADDVMPIFEDKENDIPGANQLQTPLKNKELRSPLKDITPSITKKKKSSVKSISEKYNFLTPRTMTESRFSSGSGMRRIERL